MKHTIGIISCFALSAFAVAQTQFDRELTQLREQRDKAVAAAAEPINRRYQVSLEQMLRRAMQSNDLDAAVKIKAAIAELGTATPGAAAKSPLQSLIEGSRWEWFNAAEPKGQANNWVEFYKDGEGQSGWKQPLRWSVTGPNTLRVSQGEAGNTWLFIVDPAKKTATYDATAGAGHEPRSMKFDKRISSSNPNR